MSREMPELLCPLTTYPVDDIRRRCWKEKCAWWDIDDSCCCIRVLTRALEDLASNDRARFEREELREVKT